LGLAIAKRLTELLGGMINVHSRSGARCCMTVTLSQQASEPVSSQMQQNAKTINAELFDVSESALAGLRILLVEDDRLVGDGMVQVLRSWGSNVCWEQTAAAARRHATKCDIALRCTSI